MKKLSLIIAAAFLMGTVAYAQNGTKKTETGKEVKKEEKKEMKKEEKKEVKQAGAATAPAAAPAPAAKKEEPKK